MKRPLGKIGAAFLVLGLAAGAATQAQTFTVLHSFTGGSDGAFPFGGLLGDAAGNIYGTTESQGLNCPSYGCGTVFKLDPAGNETFQYSFGSVPAGLETSDPFAGVVMDIAGNLDGTTRDGGTFGNGTVFKLDTSGNETVLYSFMGPKSGSRQLRRIIAEANDRILGKCASRRQTSQGGTS